MKTATILYILWEYAAILYLVWEHTTAPILMKTTKSIRMVIKLKNKGKTT